MQFGLITPKIPRSFQHGRYVVRRILGQGATGTVFEVIDQELEGEPIALKVLHPQLLADGPTLERFRHQVLLTRQLSHPHIVQVFDFNYDEEGNHFITMELVEGRSLRQFLDESGLQKLSFPEVQKLLADVAKGLAYAHSLGVIHRDLKPSNLLVSYEGDVKLSDFGFAKGLEHSFGLTQTGEVLGSPSYTAPEQFRGDAVDVRADVYSFGVLAFELLLGRVPFEGNSYVEQAEAHLRQTLPLVFSEDQNIPIWFRDAVMKCCEKEPRKRYSSASELSALLSEHSTAEAELNPEVLQFTFLQKSIRKRQAEKRKRFGVGLGVALLVIAFVCARQTNTRLFMGKWILRAERVLGVELTLLKAPFFVSTSPLRPNDFLQTIREREFAKVNVLSYLEAGGDIEVTDENQNTLVHLAVENGAVETLEALKEHGANLNRVNRNGETALLRSIRMGFNFSTHELLILSADFNVCDNRKVCPIHEAFQQNDFSLVSTLIQCGASPATPNAEGKNILHLAAWNHDLEMLNVILLEGERVRWYLDSRDSEGLTPLMYAVLRPKSESGVVGSIDRFLQNGASLSSRDHHGRTAVIHAVLAKNPVGLVYLLQKGANPDDRDDSGKSARDYGNELGWGPLFVKAIQHD